ncbi:hypothetical protein [Paenibacillus sp. DMB20]|uniref:hypothetical protein n=1 Tax=Paenibacillus sp. DMB20 TaxID=1642570 RepID=UPI000627BC6B|nr:hypothetical protein [Paenibacillus sp. DMB20]KKO53285.1 hypothetical protein XI25_13175 [Paenibacillus sp. DMB20]
MNPWIYIVLLGIAALLYALLLPKRREESAASDQLVKEMESTLEQYMGEIQLENEQLLQLVGQMKQEQAAKQTAQQEQLNEIRQRLLSTEQQLAAVEQRLNEAEKSISTAVAEISAGSSSAAAGEEPKPQPIPSIKDRYYELFQMFEAGKSIDMIAKAAGMQRGEVQLIFQLAKQEESP